MQRGTRVNAASIHTTAESEPNSIPAPTQADPAAPSRVMAACSVAMTRPRSSSGTVSRRICVLNTHTMPAPTLRTADPIITKARLASGAASARAALISR